MDLREIFGLFLAVSISLFTRCQAINTEYACFLSGAEEGTVNLRCPPGQRIKIREALYGRNRWGTCYYAVGDCTQRTSTTMECCGQNECQVSVKRVYMPPCGYSTFLRAVYECVTLPDLVKIRCGPETDETPLNAVPVIYKSPSIVSAPKTTFIEPELETIEETTPSVFTTTKSPNTVLSNQKLIWSTAPSVVTSPEATLLGRISRKVSLAESNNSTDNVIIWTCLVVGAVTTVLVIILVYVLWSRRKMAPQPDAEKQVKGKDGSAATTDKNENKVTSGHHNDGFIQESNETNAVNACAGREFGTHQQNLENEFREEIRDESNIDASRNNVSDGLPSSVLANVSELPTNPLPAEHTQSVTRGNSGEDSIIQSGDVSELPIVQQLHKTAEMVKQFRKAHTNEEDENVVTRDLPCRAKTSASPSTTS